MIRTLAIIGFVVLASVAFAGSPMIPDIMNPTGPHGGGTPMVPNAAGPMVPNAIPASAPPPTNCLGVADMNDGCSPMVFH